MLAGEIYSFSLGYEYEISIGMVFRQMKVDISIYTFTDDKSIFDTITASKHPRELQLMNDMCDICLAYKQNEISSLARIRL